MICWLDPPCSASSSTTSFFSVAFEIFESAWDSFVEPLTPACLRGDSSCPSPELSSSFSEEVSPRNLASRSCNAIALSMIVWCLSCRFSSFFLSATSTFCHTVSICSRQASCTFRCKSCLRCSAASIFLCLTPMVCLASFCRIFCFSRLLPCTSSARLALFSLLALISSASFWRWSLMFSACLAKLSWSFLSRSFSTSCRNRTRSSA
mmetsp:Transcript_20460/g.45137  ORF Transcript_20460/g.45137 Transcript_20460/m.45137 type:complete len:207 (-) Transcript_20460:400-1020(-)